MIKLVVEPSTPPVEWDVFVRSAAPFSIALDGYVKGVPQYEPAGPFLNLNHHEDCFRPAMHATCGQVLRMLRTGLMSTFRNGEGPTAHVFVNDCDEDVCTSWYLLKHHAVCAQTMNPLLNRLVQMEDDLDSTGGAYPFPLDLPVLRELAWVFEPYRQFRLSGGLDKKNARAYTDVIENVEGRIGRHITGRGEEIPLDTRYERIGGGPGWTMVREFGSQARTGMFSDGIRAFVSVRDVGPGRWVYTVWRISPFIRFNCRRILDACNEFERSLLTTAEELTRFEKGDLWGGGDDGGGSPRVGGSKVAPADLEKLINQVGV